MVSSKPVI